MRKDNKKALYENIMTSVAKEVKKALNEENWGGYQSLGPNAKTPKSWGRSRKSRLALAKEFANKANKVFQNYDVHDLNDQITEIADQLNITTVDLIGILDAYCNDNWDNFVRRCEYLYLYE